MCLVGKYCGFGSLSLMGSFCYRVVAMCFLCLFSFYLSISLVFSVFVSFYLSNSVVCLMKHFLSKKELIKNFSLVHNKDNARHKMKMHTQHSTVS